VCLGLQYADTSIELCRGGQVLVLLGERADEGGVMGSKDGGEGRVALRAVVWGAIADLGARVGWKAM